MINYWSASAAERAAALEDNAIDAVQCAKRCDYSEAADIVAERYTTDPNVAWLRERARELGVVQLTLMSVEPVRADREER